MEFQFTRQRYARDTRQPAAQHRNDGNVCTESERFPTCYAFGPIVSIASFLPGWGSEAGLFEGRVELIAENSGYLTQRLPFAIRSAAAIADPKSESFSMGKRQPTCDAADSCAKAAACYLPSTLTSSADTDPPPATAIATLA